MAKELHPMCAKCPTTVCGSATRTEDNTAADAVPSFCPTKCMPEVVEKALNEYDEPTVKEFARLASLQEFECYEQLPDGRRPKNPRILELIEFARKCGYKRLGLAFCAGLKNEGRILTDILENNGFEVISVRCKVSATDKEKIGIKPEEKIGGPGRHESMCNPIAQAEILNAENVDLAIMLGLCIGHDTLFIKYCRVPLTVIAVKDRVTGHNPLAVLYTSNSYYRRLMAEA
ncbi:DUF1847 domain-containing protein [Chloroflexota bacterium]